MKKFILSFLCFIFLTELHSQNNFITDSLNSHIEIEMKKWKIPGMAVAVVKDGKVLFTKGYGVLEVGKPEKVNENTLFQIASNSKAFTGTALALLEYQKKLTLNDKVTQHLPYFKLKDSLAGANATIADLLSHRIGFETFQSDFLNWNSNVSRKYLIENMKNVTPAHSFREKYGYCNVGFLAAGEIIPSVTDTSWDDYLKYRFFNPLKMTRTTTYHKDIVADKNAAKPYTLINNELKLLPYANIDNLGPAASINSSVKDISNWVLMLLDSGKFEGKQLLPWSVIEKTRRPFMINRRINNKLFPTMHFDLYGLGWALNDYEGRTLVSHTGGSNGFVTSVTLMPEEKLGVIVFTNTDQNSFFQALKYEIIDAYLNKPFVNYSEIYYQRFKIAYEEEMQALKKEKELADGKKKTPLPLEAYTGKYYNEVYGEISIVIENKKLVIVFPKHNNTKGYLEIRDETSFLCTYTDLTWGIMVTPVKTEEKTVKSITVSVNDFIDFFKYEFVKLN